MGILKEYEGREQSYLKHRVLAHYLTAWAQKQGSNSRFRDVKLVYVDCFAGPWQSRDQDLNDTSVCIGLNALAAAAGTWKTNIKVKAVFVERDDEAFARLEDYLSTREGDFETVPIHGEFGASVDRINQEIGDGAAFLFIDPTGWKGVAMRHIAPLASVRRRDVLINLMFNDVNRFKYDQREFLREQMREFFGLESSGIPPNLDEDGLLSFYRDQLRQTCGLRYTANLAIPHRTDNRTWFHLVVGGHHHEVLNLFRKVERTVCGPEAGMVRAGAREGIGQAELLLGPSPVFRARHDDLRRIRDLLERRQAGTREPFLSLWTELLMGHHVTRADVVDAVLDLLKRGRAATSRAVKRSIPDSTLITWR